MSAICSQCQQAFTTSNGDKALYERLHVPVPKFCPECSHQRRFSFRNERKYYKRKCDLTGKEIVTIFAPESPYKVYQREAWFSDRYDPLSYGRDIDFSRPFFEQLKELSCAVPWEHMVIINSENCDYCNFVVNSRNCYLSVRVDAEDAYYCYLPFNGTKSCMDCYDVVGCELCYECVDCTNCRECKYLQRCKQCVNTDFSIDCIGCTHCFGCAGLRHKEYHIFNEPRSREEYERELREYDTMRSSVVYACQKRIRELDRNRPHRFAIHDQTEEATGDYIVKSRRIQNSFDIEECEDVSDSIGIEYGKDVARSAFLYHPELCYEQLSVTYSQNVYFSYGVYNSHNIEYSMMVHQSSSDCFGCVGLKRNNYCILNKQYSKEEYEILRVKLINHMRKTGEYGEFFPPSLSPFAYNETVAQEYYPLTKCTAEEQGFRWRDIEEELPKVKRIIKANQLPDSQSDIPDDVLNWAIQGEKTDRPFKIMKRELQFYRSEKLPLPRFHPDERHHARVTLRNPRKLWKRNCAKCGEEMQTTYSPERPEIVYCEKCYLKEVY